MIYTSHTQFIYTQQKYYTVEGEIQSGRECTASVKHVSQTRTGVLIPY